MSSSFSAKSKTRKLFYKQNGKCHWCGCSCRLQMPHVATQADNNASLDHLHSKYDIRRWLQERNNDYTVMACRKCNHERGKVEHSRMYPSEQLSVSIIDILLYGNLSMYKN